MITSQQIRDFARQGYLHLPKAVPRQLIDRARLHINHWLGHHFDPARVDIYSAQSYCPELRDRPIIRDLVDASGLFEIAEALTAPGRLKPAQRGQIALRFPHPDAPEKQLCGHIDGTPGKDNGVPPGTIYSFTMLIGIALSDVDRENAGNFVLWPGSHHVLENWFRERSLHDLLDTGLPRLDYGSPTQVQWNVGDAIIAHHQTVHGIAVNRSPDIRYACFFRLHHVAHETLKEEVVRNLWLEYDGVRAAMASL